MRNLEPQEMVELSGAGGLDFVNDAARAVGGAVAQAVDSVQLAISGAISTAQAQMINSQFEKQYK